MRTSLLALFTILALFLASSAHGGAEIGFFADANGTVGTVDVVPLVPFDVYMVGRGFETGFQAVEFGASGDLGDDPGLVIVNVIGPWPPFQLDLPCDGFSCVYGTGVCVLAPESDPVVLARWIVLPVSPIAMDRMLCVEGVVPSSFPEGAAGYGDCEDSPIAFTKAANPCSASIPDGCLVVNPSFSCDPVADATNSFGAIKSLYRD